MKQQEPTTLRVSRLPDAQQRQRRAVKRRLLDLLWYGLISLAGVTVIVALLAIFIYLMSEVLPLFKPATAELRPLPVTPETSLAIPPRAVMDTAISAEVLQQFALPLSFSIDFQLQDALKRYVILANRSGEACLLQLSRPTAGCIQRLSLTDRTVSLTAITWLAGQQSLITGDSSGQLKQWFLLADKDGQVRLSWVKPFQQRNAAITSLAAESGRSGFAVLDAAGGLSLFYSTLSKPLWQKRFPDMAAARAAPDELRFNATNDQLWLLKQEQALSFLAVQNKHPEISWRTLWQKVWYESWQQPEYVWQSSGGAEFYQGKYSLVPLTVGTLKAAFYAMLVAVPLAILAALYSVCYLAEPLRSRLSNLIELIALFPTVIIGFLAAIWLAPALEQHLLALLLFVAITPLLVFLLAKYWAVLPAFLQRPTGSKLTLLLMLLLLLLSAAAAFGLAALAEYYCFEGSLQSWLSKQGIDYQQRNALVVGLAMGFAVLPVVFSLSYDALAQIPKQLTLGAYALGANQWQIVQRIMLPVAAPGILAAMMLGLSRAIGETMIILMATGNNPITNFNVFEGLRSLTATLAIELPEAAVNSSHYRVLFLVAILLFIFTFTCNTLADLVRQRLRRNLQRLD
ncbi:ABC transporter permease subunit [Alishewanella longhuensis]